MKLKFGLAEIFITKEKKVKGHFANLPLYQVDILTNVFMLSTKLYH
jgi:hypothetical protein